VILRKNWFGETPVKFGAAGPTLQNCHPLETEHAPPAITK